MLPLTNTSCLVYGSGDIPSSVRETIARDHTHRMIVAVNGAADVHSLAPDVLVYIDPGDWSSGHEDALHVHSASVPGPGIALPTWATRPLPTWTQPGRLYHVPNSAVVAAVWAMSVGCSMVGMVGCGCESDGRAEHQMREMRRVRDDAIAVYHDLRLIQTLSDWQAFKTESVGLARILYEPAKRLRTFYR